MSRSKKAPDENREEEWEIPTLDDSCMEVAEDVRRVSPGLPDEAFIYAALAARAFLKTAREVEFISRDFFEFFIQQVAKQFTPKRAREVRKLIRSRGKAARGESVDGTLLDLLDSMDVEQWDIKEDVLVWMLLALNAVVLSTSAFEPAGEPMKFVEGVPEKSAQFLTVCLGNCSEEFVYPERFEELKRKAAVRGLLGQLILQ